MSANQPRRGRPPRAGSRPAGAPVLPPPAVRCKPEELKALKRLAASRTAGIWRIKRAKIILLAMEGRSAERIMWDVRVPVMTVVRFLREFAELRLAAFKRPDREATAREAAVERVLEILENPPQARNPRWKTAKVHYVGRDYEAREIARLRSLIRERPRLCRTALAGEMCRLFGLYQANGAPRKGSALVALRRMAMDNLIALPAPGRWAKRTTGPSLRNPALIDHERLGAEIETRHLFLVPADIPHLSRLWRDVIEQYHYIGQYRLYGPQIRYLVYGSNSNGGGAAESAGTPFPPERGTLLAVLGFCPAVWRLTARDEFIAWNEEERTRNLRLIVGNSRFLILPWVRVKCLASRILGLAARRLPVDWHARYGYRPVLLETFVQLDRFSGTCYRAANWIQVGTTRGYSVHGSEVRASVPPRAILLYPLRKDFRRILRAAAGR